MLRKRGKIKKHMGEDCKEEFKEIRAKRIVTIVRLGMSFTISKPDSLRCKKSSTTMINNDNDK